MRSFIDTVNFLNEHTYKEENMKRKLTYTLASLFILLGIGLLLINPIQNYLIRKQSSSYLSVSATEIQANQTAEATFEFTDVNEVSLLDVLNAQQSDVEVPVIGKIFIPKIDLNLPIVRGVSHYNMLVGAGTLKEDMIMGLGNYSLASHNMRNENLLFAPLHRSETGMSVYITDMENIYEYQIHTREIIEPTKIEVIEDTDKPTLTLITCNYNGEKRLLVQGELVNKSPIDENANPNLLDLLSKSVGFAQ